jgi:hypothetical protein
MIWELIRSIASLEIRLRKREKEGGMIRSRLTEKQPQEGYKRETGVDLVFQLGIRLNPEPLLQQAF